MRKSGWWWIIVMFLTGCSNHILIKENTVAHVISLDREGEANVLRAKPCIIGADGTNNCQLDQSGKPFDDNDFYRSCGIDASPELRCLAGNNESEQLDANIAIIIKHLKSAVAKAREEKKKTEVFLFIHGGMVSKTKSAAEAETVLDKVNVENLLSKDRFIYPLFINWESGMMTSYNDHLFSIRQGEVSHAIGILSSPFYFTADVGRAVTRLPITYGYQAYRLVESPNVPDPTNIAYFNRKFYDSGTSKNGHGIYLGSDKLSILSRLADKATYLLPGVVKIISTPLLDFIGKSAWENMLRRTKTVFVSPNDYITNKKALEKCEADLISNPESKCDAFNRSPGGGAYKLMRALGAAKLDGVEFTLIGHSMGSIVATELLKRFGNGEENVVFDNIVYMAAAATTRDFQESVIPYLMRHDKTNFYNLTLHPYAEENEKLYDLVPRGSLLVWIDDFASDPSTIADMTFGKWENAIRALPFVPNKVRNRITLKGFGVKDPVVNIGNKPQQHSHFNDVELKFWHSEFWKVPGR